MSVEEVSPSPASNPTETPSATIVSRQFTDADQLTEFLAYNQT
ncbi:MAG: hypothetical protein AAGG51_14040 [Cyanobacteria bacterium P01_G01_bin.54]